MSRYIIDVREKFEFERDHVPGAINITPSELMYGSEKLDKIPHDAEVVLYCMTGARSRTASIILSQRGYTNVINGINKDHVLAKYK